MDFLDELSSSVLVGDGAMGTLLMERGVAWDCCFEELSISNPELISGIHSEYIAAGARIIETNTFGANAVRLSRGKFENRVSEINWSAAQLAKSAASGKAVYVAGSVGPLGITAAEASEQGVNREAVFQDQIGALLDGGARVILLETFTDLDELLLALYVKQSLHHCPVICSLVCNEEGRLYDDQSIGDAFVKLVDAGADICGANCVGAKSALRVLQEASPDGTYAVFPNAGIPREENGRLVFEDGPDAFGRSTRTLAEAGARIIGGCCGTTPAHIKAIAEALERIS